MSQHYSPATQQQPSLLADLLRILCAIFLSQAGMGVLLQVSLGKHFWLNILLTLCGYIPGLVHAVCNYMCK
ncbi:MAG: YqaE/Pmp3 family membrane protein [Planctomycetaceae bacterium]